MSNFEIDELCSILGLSGYRGCYSKDQIPNDVQTTLKPGDFVILNLQDSKDGNGTHWVCFMVAGDQAWSGDIVYFDSYGLYPPRIIRKIALKLGLDNVQYQNELLQQNSQLCGWFCLMFIKKIQSGERFSAITPTAMNDATVHAFRSQVLADL